jgi:hypothetical protein
MLREGKTVGLLDNPEVSERVTLSTASHAPERKPPEILASSGRATLFVKAVDDEPTTSSR